MPDTANHLSTEVVMLPVGEVNLYPGNPRRGNVEAIAASLARLRQYRPIVVRASTREVLCGNHTLLGARQLGWPTIAATLVDVSDEEAAAIVVADNRLADLGTYDSQALADMLVPMRAEDPDLFGITGYTTSDLDELLASVTPLPETKGDPDAIPEVPPDPITQPGDLWLLGPHRLLCGDATRRDDYHRVLAGENLAGAVVTDPPYGVAIGAKNRALDSIDRAGQVLTDLDGDQGIEQVEALWRASFSALHAVMPGGTPYYVFGPQGGDLGLLLLLLRDAGMEPRHVLIWVKNRPSFSIGRLDYDYQHEPIVYGWRPGGAHPWHAEVSKTSILNFDRPQASPLHPTSKPVDLIAELVTNSTKRGEMVLDPFAGSGTALVAAHRLDRRARLLEIAPGYCDVICRRYQLVTGDKAVLESTGEPYDFAHPGDPAKT